jgi:hypothetical protein
MKLFYTTILIIALSVVANAQNKLAEPGLVTVSDTTYTYKYNKLKTLYIKELNSESYKKWKASDDSFTAKLHADKGTKFDNDFTVLDYIKTNVTNTDFGTYEAAEKEYTATSRLLTAVAAENKEYYDYIIELVTKGETQLVSDVTLNVILNNPDKI